MKYIPTPEKREEFDTMLTMPPPGQSVEQAAPFSEEQEADSWADAFATLGGG